MNWLQQIHGTLGYYINLLFKTAWLVLEHPQDIYLYCKCQLLSSPFTVLAFPPNISSILSGFSFILLTFSHLILTSMHWFRSTMDTSWIMKYMTLISHVPAVSYKYWRSYLMKTSLLIWFLWWKVNIQWNKNRLKSQKSYFSNMISRF